MEDPPITAAEIRNYLWQAINMAFDHDGLIPCAPRYEGDDAFVMNFQRVLPQTYGVANCFRIKIEPVEAKCTP